MTRSTDHFPFSFYKHDWMALPSGALFWPSEQMLVVSDLHFGKSARLAAVGGAQLPPYETRETLARLDTDLATTQARKVVCLGDSFDAPGVETALPDAERLWISRLQAGRDWVWIEGNHDPGPVSLGGAHRASLTVNNLTFRHIADPQQTGEISGHYHPKFRLSLKGRSLSRPCFLLDQNRLILPAYGCYTGGLRCDDIVLRALMHKDAKAILTGTQQCAVPMLRK